jgi:phytoene dehydrogenase-like protein
VAVRPRPNERPGGLTAVIGAGPAGLTAARVLAGRGLPVAVFERDDQVGGLARTVEYKGSGSTSEAIASSPKSAW